MTSTKCSLDGFLAAPEVAPVLYVWCLSVSVCLSEQPWHLMTLHPLPALQNRGTCSTGLETGCKPGLLTQKYYFKLKICVNVKICHKTWLNYVIMQSHRFRDDKLKEQKKISMQAYCCFVRVIYTLVNQLWISCCINKQCYPLHKHLNLWFKANNILILKILLVARRWNKAIPLK